MIVVPPLTAPLIGGLDEHVKQSAFLYGALILNLIMCILCLFVMCTLPRERIGKPNGAFLCILGVGSIVYFLCHIGAAFEEFIKANHMSESRHEGLLLAGTVLRDSSLILSIVIQIVLLSCCQVGKWSETTPSDDRFSKFISHAVFYIASIIISFEIVELAHSFTEPALEMFYKYSANTTEFTINCLKSHKGEWIDYVTYFLIPLHHEFVVLALSLWLTLGSHHEDHGALDPNNENIQADRHGINKEDGSLENEGSHHDDNDETETTSSNENIMDVGQGISRSARWKKWFKKWSWTILIGILIIIVFIASLVYMIFNILALFFDPPRNSEFYMHHSATVALYVVVLVYTSFGLFAPKKIGLNSQEFQKNPLNVEEYILLIMCGFEVTFFLIKIAAASTCQASKLVCEGYANAREYVPLSLSVSIIGILQVSTQAIFLLLCSREKRFCEKSVDKKQSWVMFTILMAILFSNLFKWMANSIMKGVNEHDRYELEPILELLFGCVTTKIVVLVFFRFLAFYRFHSAYMALELVIKYKQRTLRTNRNIPYNILA